LVDPSAAHHTPVEKQLAVPVQADDPIGLDAFSLRVEQDDAVSHIGVRRPDERDPLWLQSLVGHIARMRPVASSATRRSTIE
jgi:hypothetical protein